MTNGNRELLSINKKTKQQIIRLLKRTNATSYGEVVRKALDLLEKELIEREKQEKEL